jgi:predicted O-methyltransferase YrrM
VFIVFHDIPEQILGAMAALEELDEIDRANGTAHLQRLRQIPPETGRFLALMLACAPPGAIIEIGTSGGYSTLWLALACRDVGRSVTTYEVLDHKARLASKTFHNAGVLDVVTSIEADFLDRVDELDQIAFCFLDAEKDVYRDCYEAVVPKLVPGGLLIADNAISHHDDLRKMIERAIDDTRVDATVLTIGKGELFCRKR